jgi:hypothetical protein
VRERKRKYVREKENKRERKKEISTYIYREREVKSVVMPVITPAAATDEKLRPLRSSSFSRTCSANQCADII